MDIRKRMQVYIKQNLNLLRETKEQMVWLKGLDSTSNQQIKHITKLLGVKDGLYVDLEMEIQAYIAEKLDMLNKIEESLLNMEHEGDVRNNLKLISSYAHDISSHSFKIMELASQMKIEERLFGSKDK